jgi:hypothetical protein
MRCEGLYPWFIYKNQGPDAEGKPVFAPTPVIKYQPIQLESDTGDSNITGASVTTQNHALIDFDGDGILDAVVRPQKQQQPPGDDDGRVWFVWLGDGSGGFSPKMHTFVGRQSDETLPWRHNEVSRTDPTELGADGGNVATTVGLLDFNGDGVPDHWVRDRPLNQTNVAFHGGSEFRF